MPIFGNINLPTTVEWDSDQFIDYCYQINRLYIHCRAGEPFRKLALVINESLQKINWESSVGY